jgi:hypothetical protein
VDDKTLEQWRQIEGRRAKRPAGRRAKPDTPIVRVAANDRA